MVLELVTIYQHIIPTDITYSVLVLRNVSMDSTSIKCFKVFSKRVNTR